MESAIYTGTLRHRRFHPKRHDFTYSIFMVSLDIDRLAELMAISPFTGYNRWNWASFYDADHFGDLRSPLRERLARDAHEHATELPDGRIFLLTHLRYLGYNFNPVSFFYCYDKQERLKAILAEVNNTFGETHNYWLDEKNGSNRQGANAAHYRFRKEFHVSPFLEMDCEYRWTFTDPADSLLIQTNSLRGGEPVFDATLKLEHQEWSARNLHRVLLRHPWMTAKVIAGIHWQAVRLWAKNVPLVHHPGAGTFKPASQEHFGAAWSAGAPRTTKLEQEVVEKS
ncbi:MAG TPA: DUF1365 domain-containing protein [Terriglobales bacterium]